MFKHLKYSCREIVFAQSKLFALQARALCSVACDCIAPLCYPTQLDNLRGNRAIFYRPWVASGAVCPRVTNIWFSGLFYLILMVGFVCQRAVVWGSESLIGESEPLPPLCQDLSTHVNLSLFFTYMCWYVGQSPCESKEWHSHKLMPCKPFACADRISGSFQRSFQNREMCDSSVVEHLSRGQEAPGSITRSSRVRACKLDRYVYMKENHHF